MTHFILLMVMIGAMLLSVLFFLFDQQENARTKYSAKATAEGLPLMRIKTALFGARPYPQKP